MLPTGARAGLGRPLALGTLLSGRLAALYGLPGLPGRLSARLGRRTDPTGSPGFAVSATATRAASVARTGASAPARQRGQPAEHKGENERDGFHGSPPRCQGNFDGTVSAPGQRQNPAELLAVSVAVTSLNLPV